MGFFPRAGMLDDWGPNPSPAHHMLSNPGQVTFGSSSVTWEFSTSTTSYAERGLKCVDRGKGLEPSLASEQEVFWSHAHP